MSYIDAFIPACGGYGWQGGPEFKTVIVEMRNGWERRNAEIANARHSFNIPYNNISREDYMGIKQLHLTARGRLHNFKFIDELDSEADNEVFDTGNGVKTVFQLRKLSSIDGVSYERNVYVPLQAGTPGLPDSYEGISITNNGIAATPTIDYDRGLVTFAVAPGNGNALRWSGRFAMWVRFNQDDLPFSIDNPNFRSGQVSIIEDKPPPP